jgi:hypothetical protein
VFLKAFNWTSTNDPRLTLCVTQVPVVVRARVTDSVGAHLDQERLERDLIEVSAGEDTHAARFSLSILHAGYEDTIDDQRQLPVTGLHAYLIGGIAASEPICRSAWSYVVA